LAVNPAKITAYIPNFGLLKRRLRKNNIPGKTIRTSVIIKPPFEIIIDVIITPKMSIKITGALKNTSDPVFL
jgi:hypothetical protein